MTMDPKGRMPLVPREEMDEAQRAAVTASDGEPRRAREGHVPCVGVA
jgi:hypothetical protein